MDASKLNRSQQAERAALPEHLQPEYDATLKEGVRSLRHQALQLLGRTLECHTFRPDVLADVHGLKSDASAAEILSATERLRTELIY